MPQTTEQDSIQSVAISQLSETSLDEVDALGSKYKKTIGFLTKETLREYLGRNRVLGARSSDGELIGYLLFADYPDRFRIGQLCVAEHQRGKGIARMLVDALKALTTTQKVIRLRCRRDFKTASKTWKALGFIPLDEKPGRSAEGLPLTLWCYQLAEDDELGLWKAGTTDDSLDAVIDAHIFYDFGAKDSPSSEISKSLLNDFLVDSLNLWITDELFLEIERQEDTSLRRCSLTRAQGMDRITYGRKLAEDFTALLRDILPYERDSDKSDIHHIAKTAASDLTTFVTKDEKILRRADEIRAVTDVSVIHPVDLVSSIHEVTEKQTYTPQLVSGFGLRWLRMKGHDLVDIDLTKFNNHGENKGALMEQLRVFLAKPSLYNCQMLQSEGTVVAIRVLSIRGKSKILEIPFARIAYTSDTGLIASFLMADTLSCAVDDSCESVEVLKEGCQVFLGPTLRRMEFSEHSDSWTKLVLCQCSDHEAIANQLSERFPPMSEALSQTTTLEFERRCAPLAINSEIPVFLVPIQQSFAMGLIDNDEAANDLFGGNTTSLLRWDNVYYRKKSRHKMLKAPARILWYVSGKKKAVIGISHLDEVQIGRPKDLFRKYRKFGVLEWRDLYSMCGQDINKEIMALKFSRTFLFRHAVSLKTMRRIFAEDGISESLQSPSPIPFNSLKKFFQLGFSPK